MSPEDDTGGDGGFEEGPSSVMVLGGEEVEEEKEEGGERVGEEHSCIRFQLEMTNPLDSVKRDASGAQFDEQFECIEYEALAQRKRKLDHDQGEGSVKKLRQAETAGATRDEIVEAMNYGSRRRRRKKLKKKGRRKGGKNRVSPEVIIKSGDANLHFAHGRYEAVRCGKEDHLTLVPLNLECVQAISLLKEVILLAPDLYDSYHTLGLVYKRMGNVKKAMGCYTLAAVASPKNRPFWKHLMNWSIEQENMGQAWDYLSKAITAEPNDISLKYLSAKFHVDAGKYKNAADTYYQIVCLCPDDVEALKNAIKFYKEAGLSERCVSILDDYVKEHPPDSNLNMLNVVVSLFIENKEYGKALAYIENAKKLHGFREELQLSLTIQEGICHAHLRNLDEAEDCFSLLQEGHNSDEIDLTTSVAGCLLDLEHYELSLKYYLMLEGKASDEVSVLLKVAQCYIALKDTLSAIQVLYKAIEADENNIDARITLASLLIELARDNEVVLLLSAPPYAGSYVENQGDGPKSWWLNWRIKLKLSHFYRDKEMREDFVNLVSPLVRESLLCIRKKVKHKKLPRSVLLDRAKILEDGQPDSVLQKFRASVPDSDRTKALRAKRTLKNRAMIKEEKKLAALAAGLDWESDDTDDDVPQSSKEPPLPALLNDEEQYCLIKDLCHAFTSLGRYDEALEILRLALKLSHKVLPTKKKEELRCLGSRIAFKVKDPYDAFGYVKRIVFQNPRSIAAWNCYYKLALRLDTRDTKHAKFIHYMRSLPENLVPPMIITGNQLTMTSRHQAAAREYLEAYKLMPESPLVNLCAGSSLINLALGHRLQNRHQSVAQGLAFLYNNLRLCGEDNQEALYNIGRACHHVGLVSLAASYYEKVLAIRETSYRVPELVDDDHNIVRNGRLVCCDLRREAAFNLHLIYKSSGAVDLARQVLRDHCTF